MYCIQVGVLKISPGSFLGRAVRKHRRFLEIFNEGECKTSLVAPTSGETFATLKGLSENGLLKMANTLLALQRSSLLTMMAERLAMRPTAPENIFLIPELS